MTDSDQTDDQMDLHQDVSEDDPLPTHVAQDHDTADEQGVVSEEDETFDEHQPPPGIPIPHTTYPQLCIVHGCKRYATMTFTALQWPACCAQCYRSGPDSHTQECDEAQPCCAMNGCTRRSQADHLVGLHPVGELYCCVVCIESGGSRHSTTCNDVWIEYQPLSTLLPAGLPHHPHVPASPTLQPPSPTPSHSPTVSAARISTRPNMLTSALAIIITLLLLIGRTTATPTPVPTPPSPPVSAALLQTTSNHEIAPGTGDLPTTVANDVRRVSASYQHRADAITTYRTRPDSTLIPATRGTEARLRAIHSQRRFPIRPVDPDVADMIEYQLPPVIFVSTASAVPSNNIHSSAKMLPAAHTQRHATHVEQRLAAAIGIVELRLDDTDPTSPAYVINDVVTTHMGLTCDDLRGYHFIPTNAQETQLLATVAAVLYGERMRLVPDATYVTASHSHISMVRNQIGTPTPKFGPAVDFLSRQFADAPHRFGGPDLAPLDNQGTNIVAATKALIRPVSSADHGTEHEALVAAALTECACFELTPGPTRFALDLWQRNTPELRMADVHAPQATTDRNTDRDAPDHSPPRPTKQSRTEPLDTAAAALLSLDAKPAAREYTTAHGSDPPPEARLPPRRN